MYVQCVLTYFLRQNQLRYVIAFLQYIDISIIITIP